MIIMNVINGSAHENCLEILIKRIRNRELRVSLEQIHIAASRILNGVDAPRIHQYYTDHGIPHIYRVLCHICRLLPEQGSPLEYDEELYTLIASALLHDIGMQYDVIRFPKILEIARKKYKANIDKDVDPKSDEFLRICRENHNYLSAAWIDYAYNNSEDSGLGPASKSIPENLISDIEEIIIYHSNLSINRCPKGFKYFPDMKKRLIAAILRLCDELDIDNNRIIDRPPFDFHRPSINALYWWLHSKTNISLNNNEITISIILHPSDNREVGRILEKFLIERFKTKNEEVFNVLRAYGIPIFVSDKSGVIEDDNARKFSRDAKRTLRVVTERPIDPLFQFAEEIKSWLEAIQYKVTDPSISRIGIIDMTAGKKVDGSKLNILIRSVNNISLEIIIESRKKLRTGFSGVWLITDTHVPARLKREAENRNIKVFILDEFIKEIIWAKWDPYFDAIIAQIDDINLKAYYVDLDFFELNPQKNDLESCIYIEDRSPRLDEFVDRWMESDINKNLFLFGDFGAGKTWFCLHYFNRQYEKYLRGPSKERMPIYINLASLTRATNHKQLITNLFQEQYGIEFVGSPYNIFENLNNKGKLLIIFDGFDQMTQKVDDEIAKQNFIELMKFVSEKSKIIITCRTEFFRNIEEINELVKYSAWSNIPLFNIIYIQPFTRNQINEAIIKRLGNDDEGRRKASQILKDDNLSELASKPVLLELLLDALSDENHHEIKKYSHVYLLATERFLLERRTIRNIPISKQLQFLCELSWSMINENKFFIYHGNLLEKLRDLFGIERRRNLDYLDFIIRSRTMLIRRDAEGYYGFAHKSFAEYFVALKFGAEIGCLNSEFLDRYGKIDDTSVLPETVSDVLILKRAFCAKSLANKDMQGVRKFLVEMIDPGKLWDFIAFLRNNQENGISSCMNNALCIYQDLSHRGIYPDITNFPDLMPIDRTPEAIILLRPAILEKIDIEIKKIEDEQSRELVSELEKINQIKNLLKEGDLIGASSLAEGYRTADLLRNFCLAVQGYVALQSLYLRDFDKAVFYLRKYRRCGGGKLWYQIKYGLVLQFRGKDGDEERARKIYKSVLRKRSKYECEGEEGEIELRKMKGRALLYLGIQDRIDGYYYKAISKYNRARQIFFHTGDIYHEGMALAQLGIAYRMLGKYRNAISAYSTAKDVFAVRRFDEYRLACVMGRLGTAYRLSGQHDKAIKSYRDSIRLFEKHNDQYRKAYVQKQLGTTYIVLGKWTDAIPVLNSAAEVFHFIKQFEREMVTRYNLGIACLMQGRYEEAARNLTISANYYNEKNDSWLESLALSALGNSYRMLDNYDRSYDAFCKGLEIVRRHRNRHRESWFLQRIGKVLTLQHRYPEAINYFENSLKILDQLSNENSRDPKLSLMKAKIIGDLGYAYRKMNSLDEAMKNFISAEELFKNEKDCINWCTIIDKKSGVYLIKGQIDEAIKGYEKAQNILESHSSENGDSAFSIIFDDIYFMHGIRFTNININKVISGRIYRNLGDAYYRKGNPKKALENLNKSLEIFKDVDDPDQLGQCLCLLGMVNRDSLNFGIALEYFNESDKIFENINDNYLRGWVRIQFGIYYLFLKQWKDAKISLDLAMKLLHSKDYKIETYYKYNLFIAHLSRALCLMKPENIDPKNGNTYYREEINTCRSIAKELEIQDRLGIPIISEIDLARFYAVLGEISESINYLKEAVKKRQMDLRTIKQDPFIDLIRENYLYKDWISRQDLSYVPDYSPGS